MDSTVFVAVVSFVNLMCYGAPTGNNKSAGLPKEVTQQSCVSTCGSILSQQEGNKEVTKQIGCMKQRALEISLV